ncbi:hypothetical protein [Intrasporangium sp.]|uniref:hypothetical protein n=1 Tax=Intrasporangium sp. TaxID=1925024 RepID=UPI003221EF70
MNLLPALPADQAAAELHAAAVLADTRAHRDPFSPWTALAAQLRLVAAGLHPAPATLAPRRDTIAGHVAAALERLDTPGPEPAEEDAGLWRGHLTHLREQAVRLDAAAGQPRGRS